MVQNIKNLLNEAYTAFNNRNITEVLKLMSPDVKWPNGWEGGYVTGHNEVEAYWTRQWAELNPIVKPLSVNELPGGKFEVDVHQHVEDLNGVVLFDGIIKHVYTIENGLIKTMEIFK